MMMRGIQLIELVMVIAIVMILASLAPFCWRHLFIHAQETMLLNDLLQTIQTAQSEAQARGVAIALCQSKDQTTCAGQWMDGFMIFMNENQDGKVRHVSEIVAAVKPQLREGILFLRSYPHYRGYLLFQSQSTMTNDNSTFWYCRPSQDKPAWAIIINRHGRLKVVYPDKKGMIVDSKDQSLLCS